MKAGQISMHLFVFSQKELNCPPENYRLKLATVSQILKIRPRNFSVLRQMALNLLRKINDGQSIKRKMKVAAMDSSYTLKVLFTGAGSKSYA
jgi:hypothetical protein